jgi:hypothetical protein
MNTVCIILVIILALIIIRAAMNKGKLWKSKDEKFRQACCDLPSFMPGSCKLQPYCNTSSTNSVI